MRKVLALVLLFAAVSVCADQPTDVRVIQLRHHMARDAAAMVEALLSSEGSVLIHPGRNTITVRDRPAITRQIAERLAAWDVEPHPFRVRVRLIMASSAPAGDDQPKARLEGFGAELTGLFRWGGFEDIDSYHVRVREGVEVETRAGGNFTVRFTLRTVPGEPERVQLAPCEVSRTVGHEHGVGLRRTLLRSAVNLQLGQTGILIASRSEEAQKALIVILAVDRESSP